jgi:ketosteroid isomerase-like protein
MTAFDEAEIRGAERRLVAALESPDPEAWVYEYTADAVFDAGGEHPVEGREGLLRMARAMRPLTEVTFRPLRTVDAGDMVAVWMEGSWMSGEPAERRKVEVRGILVWRRDSDGQWRVAMEHINARV